MAVSSAVSTSLSNSMIFLLDCTLPPGVHPLVWRRSPTLHADRKSPVKRSGAHGSAPVERARRLVRFPVKEISQYAAQFRLAPATAGSGPAASRNLHGGPGAGGDGGPDLTVRHAFAEAHPHRRPPARSAC